MQREVDLGIGGLGKAQVFVTSSLRAERSNPSPAVSPNFNVRNWIAASPSAPRNDELLHIRIVRTTAALRRDPVDVLIGVLDVAGLAVDAVLRIDLELHRPIVLLKPFIDPRRAIAGRRAGIDAQFALQLQRRVLQLQMTRLILGMVGVAKLERRQTVETDNAIRLGIND